ncbi:MAG: O-antigen ligase family protein [Chitinophagaceae bacterium]
MANIVKPGFISSLTEWLHHRLSEKKFNTILGLSLVFIWGIAIAYISYETDQTLPAVLILLCTGIATLIICLKYPLMGLYFTSVFSTLFALPGRFFKIQSPVGILVEVFTYVLLFTVLQKSALKKESTTAFWNNAISIILMIIMTYYIIELANPALYSKIGWSFFFRKQVSFVLFYFISYMVLNSYDKIKSFIKFWIVLVLIIALYGIKQQLFGLAEFEKVWLQSSPVLIRLYYQAEFIRKFSFLTDPAAFGIICAAFGLFTLVLAIRISGVRKKLLLFAATFILLLASFYSGTRTCNLMIAAGLFAYGVFTLNEKKTYLVMLLSLVSVIFLLFGPLKNLPVISRIRSTLDGSNDASAVVRDNNRHAIQPYIHAHPLGGGLNTSSVEGKFYAPLHPLAGFPPDSGYLKILLEQGWIGFGIQLIFYFVLLKRGIDGFFKARNAHIKSIYIALTICLFAMIVGQYTQIAIAQYPLILFFYSSLAILVKLIDYDIPVPSKAAG